MTSRLRQQANRAAPVHGSARRWVLAVCALLIVAIGVASGTASHAAGGAPRTGSTTAAQTAGRGTPLWVEHIATLRSADAASRYLTHAGYSPGDVRYGVQLFRIVYRTIDPGDHPTTASGLLALPVHRRGTLTTVSFAHGTTSYRGDAPSSLPDDGFATAPAVEYAAAGYAAVAPDYLGLGIGPGSQPWFVTPSETVASLDLLRAARTFTAGRATRVGSDVLVAGFSQGASAALGLAHALTGGADPHFRVKAVAPVSGAYAFGSVELPAVLSGRIAGPVAVPYVSYLLTSYDEVYGVYRSPSEVFREPYADRVETLFNSDVPGKDMVQALPTTLDKLLTPRGFELLHHPSGGLAEGLAVADAVCDWHTSVPIRLYYADRDEQAVNGNTTECAHALHMHGTRFTETDLGTPMYAGSRHLGSGVAGITQSLHWFEQVAPQGR